MAVFTEVPGATVVTRSGGVFRQVPVYVYDGRVFAKQGSGFVALHRDNATSVPKMSWEALEGIEALAKPGKSALYMEKQP